eukprot:CAMPEP_0117469200 /NCGR_PEP_ID=MMETSP0784-20121206/6568_1 /TAXON_ID=39447 /ORGANISM="" /LENGTH=304 /DNA_ID=CAMNT_0005263231 /DNA_START=147 /DNA_END=1058 /DNA_ORIENTATION=-
MATLAFFPGVARMFPPWHLWGCQVGTGAIDLRRHAVLLDGGRLPGFVRGRRACRAWDAAHWLDHRLIRLMFWAREAFQRRFGFEAERGLRVGPSNWLHEAEQRICELFGLDPCPDLFLSGEAVLFACAGSTVASGQCGNRGFVVLSQGILTQLTRDEVVAVMAHELAHLALGHSVRRVADVLDLYKLCLASLMLNKEEDVDKPASDVADIVGLLASLWFLGLRSRAAELSADRAMLAVVDTQVALAALVKMHLPGESRDPEVLVEEALRAAARRGGLMQAWALITARSHPCLALRAAALCAYAS